MAIGPGTPPFPRSICACPEDIQSCYGNPGHLVPWDVPRIAAVLVAQGWTDDLLDVLAAAEIVVATQSVDRGDIRGVAVVATITPRRTTDQGRCIFLTAEDRCAIHAVSPFGCAYVDEHMTGDARAQRMFWSFDEIERSAAYRALRATLPPVSCPGAGESGAVSRREAVR